MFLWQEVFKNIDDFGFKWCVVNWFSVASTVEMPLHLSERLSVICPLVDGTFRQCPFTDITPVMMSVEIYSL